MFSIGFKEFSFVLMIIPNLPEGRLRNVASKWTQMRCNLSSCHMAQASEFKLITYCIGDLVFKLLIFFFATDFFFHHNLTQKSNMYIFSQVDLRAIILHSPCLNSFLFCLWSEVPAVNLEPST